MKKNIRFLLGSVLALLTVLVTYSCTSDDTNKVNEIQETKINSINSTNTNIYAQADWKFKIRIQLLRVPKKLDPLNPGSGSISCKWGLGFCISIGLGDYLSNEHVISPTLTSNDEVIIPVELDELNNKLKLYLPSDIVDLGYRSRDEVNQFIIYDDMTFLDSYTLKKGEYLLNFDQNGNLLYEINYEKL